MSTYFNGEQLFFEREPFIKTAKTKLGDDPKQWESEILDTLHQQHPYLVDSRININMKKVDPESGSGIGAVVLDDKINVPVVVQNYRMAPLDVFFNDSDIVPLTRERIEQALKTLAIGKPVAPAKGEATDSSLSSMTQAPYDGKYTFASSLQFSEQEFAEAINRSYNESGFVFDLAHNSVWKEVLSSYLSGAQDHEKVAEAPKYSLVEATPFEYEVTKEAGIYNVPTSKGDKVGLLVPITEKLASNSDRWLFVSLTDGSYATLSDPAVPHKPIEHLKVAAHNVETGYGVFVSNNGKLQATDVLEVLCKFGSDKVMLRDGMGRKYNLVKTAEVSQIEIGGGIIAVPTNAAFFPIKERVEVVHVKVANLLENGPNALAITKQHARLYFHGVKDWEFENLLSKEGSYPDEVLGLLTPYFDDQSLNLMVAVPEGKTKFFEVKPTEVVKTAENLEAPALSDEQLSAINHAAAILDKTAADFLKLADDATRDTVDSLLGLNFLNKQNLHRFIDNMDKIGEARQVVGQLLVASRLGLDVDDSPLRTAFFALDEVEQDLQQLYNVTTAGR